jgi:hypothetical protein
MFADKIFRYAEANRAIAAQAIEREEPGIIISVAKRSP